MDLHLKDKSVLVLAAGSGIGRGVALEFAQENAKIMIIGRTESKLKDAQQYILTETGNKVEYITADLINGDDIKWVGTFVTSTGSDLMESSSTAINQTDTFDIEFVITLEVDRG